MGAKRLILKALRWVGITLARELVEKAQERTPRDVARISPAHGPGPVVIDGKFRERMLTHPEELSAEIRRVRGQQP